LPSRGGARKGEEADGAGVLKDFRQLVNSCESFTGS